MRSIFPGINQIEQFGVLNKNRERENCLNIFFRVFSLFLIFSLSHLPKPSLPHPFLTGSPLFRQVSRPTKSSQPSLCPDDPCLPLVRRLTQSICFETAARTELFFASRRRSSHLAATTDLLQLKASSWSC